MHSVASGSFRTIHQTLNPTVKNPFIFLKKKESHQKLFFLQFAGYTIEKGISQKHFSFD